MNPTELKIWKLIAAGAALVYLYKLTQAKGGSLAGQVNQEAFVNLASEFVPGQYRGHAKAMGHRLMNQIIQE